LLSRGGGSLRCRSKNFGRWADHRTYPIPLETLLRTEEAIFYAQLEAGRTLERAGIVVAVGAAALALCFTF